MTDLHTGLSGQELVTIHNQLVGSDQQLKRWSKSKALLIEKIEGLRAETRVEEMADSSGSFPAFEHAEATKPPTVKELVLSAATDPMLSCQQIAEAVNETLGTSTTARSVASIICVANKIGADIPKRVKAKNEK